ncbi:PrsW family glutamic-type intramembrane protease [Bythopirellula polymerisocia]|uniref:Protease PrsW n=1 Tax=Bythopirellula polymerisocia TaxID=2528003 RepID=A0A5C6CD23_9BACT|nr:PrsW family glutamic-type intramembrane protease [Bythopirellula polymerisocia]TWU21955.1 hypothetical protein Pla144_44220 [Bythopirellula polymerisocia]
MNWQHYSRLKSRDPAYLWRMVIGIVAAGVVLGWLAQSLAEGQGFSSSTVDTSKHDRLEELASQGEWWQVWWAIPRLMFVDLSLGVIALALFAGCCWLVFLLQALRAHKFRDWRLWGAMVAVSLGILSIWPTRFFSLWQEFRWHLDISAELLPGLRFFVLGVGLREELAKLLCLLPLLPIFVRKRDEAAALILSGCVGLGFAIIENMNYLTASRGSATLGRFLTANPFHIALTGLIGLAVYRACLDFRNQAPQALAMFGVLVFAHGFYDAAIVLPDLADYSMAGTIIFALVMYQFFHELRSLRTNGNEMISLTATFLLGISLLTAATFIYISALAGTASAADNLMTDVIGLAVMVYLFLREMPETMVSV